jgi:hypothetical protein
MTTITTLFPRRTLERAAEALRGAPACGMTAMDLAIEIQLSFSHARRLCTVLARPVPHPGKWRKGELQLFHLHEEWEAKLEANVVRTKDEAPELIVTRIEGMCLDCTCKVQPSDFLMRNGRPVLPQCPKAPPLKPGFGRQVVVRTHTRDGVPVPLAQQHRHRVLQTLKASEVPMTMDDLQRVTGILSTDLAPAMTTLLARAEIVRIIRTRPGRAGIAMYAMPDALPDPLRAS